MDSNINALTNNHLNQEEIDRFRNNLPPEFKKSLTKVIIENIDTAIDDTSREYSSAYISTLISQCSILNIHKVKLIDYIEAVRFSIFIKSGDTQTLAFKKTFPNREKDLEIRFKDNTSKKLADQIKSLAHIYYNSDIVLAIIDATIIPDYIKWLPARYIAMASLLSIIEDTNVIARDRVAAANYILIHSAKPVEHKITHKIEKSTLVENMRDSITMFAEEQLKAIKNTDDKDKRQEIVNTTSKDVIARNTL